MISRGHVAMFIMLAGVGVLMSRWGDVATILSGSGAREKTISLWSTSGTPEFEKSLAREFEANHPDVKVNINFAQSGTLSDVVWASFVSGRAPDVVGIPISDLRERIATGMIRPLDELVERQLRESPDFLKDRLDGNLLLYRYHVNPNDRFLKEIHLFPLEASRLLAMDGKVVGVRSAAGFPTLTYNRRIFQEAAKMFPNEGMVDAAGNALPPRTWAELRRKARVITDYGKRAEELAVSKGEPYTRPYGLVAQGQRPTDLMRGLEPIAATAGSRGFDFAGKAWLPGQAGPAGRFDMANPAIIGAFKLYALMQQDGSLLPGMSSRQYEDVRTQVALGTAAMLIDGWHAALIGKDRVPWAKDDIGTAPIPVPDEETEAMLGMKLGRGVAYKSTGSEITCITSTSQWPWEAWRWQFFFDNHEPAQRRGSVRGGLPGTRSAARHINDPAWFPYPYQREAWDVGLTRSAFWPEAPIRTAVRVPTTAEVLHGLFAQLGQKDLAQLEREAREGLERYSNELNASLAQRVAVGEEDPRRWTIPDFNPLNPEAAFEYQKGLSVQDGDAAKLAVVREQLPAEYRDREYGFSTSASPWLLLAIPMLMLLAVGGVIGVSLWRSRRGGPSAAATLRDARRNWFGYVFVFPAMIMLFAFVIYPSLYQVYLSFHTGQGVGPMRFVGWQNFLRISEDLIFWKRVVPNTLLYMVVVTAVQISGGLLLATMLNNTWRGGGVLRTLFFVPLVTSLSAVSVVFIGLLGGENSVLNSLLDSAGLANLPYWAGLVDRPGMRLDWLGNPKTDLACVLFVGIWHALPYTIILFLAGLQSISPELYEAARVDGANAWQRFVHVTIPELAPVTILIAFNSLIGAAKAMAVVLVMTGGGGASRSSEVVATYIFKWGFTRPPDQQPDIGYASALGIVYATLLGVLVVVNLKFISGGTFLRFLRVHRHPVAAGGATA